MANFVIGVLNFLINVWNGIDFLNVVTIPNVPYLAKGGIVKMMTPAVLHPNEVVLPLDSPEAEGMLGGGNEEMLNRLDIITELLATQINMKRKKALGGR
jgi:hypothetical protein